MVGKKISALPVIPSAPLLTDIFAQVQPATDGATYKTTFQQLLTLYLANLGVLPAANGATGVANPTIHTIPIAQGSSAFNFVGPLTNGQLLIGANGSDPIAAELTAGTGISITNGAGAITIELSSNPSNSFVKFSSNIVSSLITTSGTISVNDIIPQITDGTQIMTLSHTPLNSANILEIDVTVQTSCVGDAQVTAALFQDAISNAIAAGGCDGEDTGTRVNSITFKKIMTAGTTSAINFSVRAGSSDGSALYINGQTATRAWGGVSATTITVKEYTP